MEAQPRVVTTDRFNVSRDGQTRNVTGTESRTVAQEPRQRELVTSAPAEYSARPVDLENKALSVSVAETAQYTSQNYRP